MALEISTVGARVRWALETTENERPIGGYSLIPDVSEAPDFPLDVDTLDASNISDLITRYIPGRQDPGGAKTLALNHTENALSVWEQICAAYEAVKTSGLAVWFEYLYPNATRAFYWRGIPKPIGNNGISQNAVSTLNATVIPTGVGEWVTYPILMSVAITTLPTKTAYSVGEAFDPAGMVVTADYVFRGETISIPVTDYTVSVPVFTTASAYNERVIFEDYGYTETSDPITITVS